MRKIHGKSENRKRPLESGLLKESVSGQENLISSPEIHHRELSPLGKVVGFTFSKRNPIQSGTGTSRVIHHRQGIIRILRP